MLQEESLDFFKRLLSCSGPSGFEERTAECYREYLASFADRVYTDVTGNTFGIINEGAKLKVMLAGHYDEIGFQVTHISDEGLLYFRSVGGVDKLTVPGTEVCAASATCLHSCGAHGRQRAAAGAHVGVQLHM